VAWDCDRQDWRTFRVDRLGHPAADATRFIPRALPSADTAAYVTENLSGASYRYQARVTLHAPAAEMAARGLDLRGTVHARGKRICEYRTGDDSLDWLAMRIGMLGVEFDVHEPPELAQLFQELAARYMRAGGSR